VAHNVKGRIRSVIDDETERAVSQDAQRANIAAGSVLADLIRTTLGPKGLDTMTISDGSVLLMNNGYRVLNRSGTL
jgi:archaeal chaperonin